MADVAFEEFSAPGSELALPPLFGGHILEVEFEGAGLGAGPRQEEEEEEEEEEGGEEEAEAARRRRDLELRKLQALARRVREIEQVNDWSLSRLRRVTQVTRRLQRERRFLMKVLDSYGDDFRQGQLTVLLQDEGSPTDAPTPGNAENEPPEKEPPPNPPPAPPSPPPEPPKRRRRKGGAAPGPPGSF
ncbi:TCF3 fusion partner, partial [Pezoporus wallicus]|uniref:TCF3 fusion partner n=1 Tax=Pezoporus wallicus TaxID=35540 RepID=UPI00254A061A